MKGYIINIDFCKSLSNLLLDPFLQIRFNTLNALINLIVSYSENDIDLIFLFNTNLLVNLNLNLKEYTLNKDVLSSSSEQEKIRKILKNIFDLLNLIIELYDEDKQYNKIDFSEILKISLLIITNSGNLQNINEEVIISSSLFLADMFAVKPFLINEELNHFITFAIDVISNSEKGNLLIKSAFAVSLFYIFVVNYKHIDNCQIKLKEIIFIIFKGINLNLSQEIFDLNLTIQNYVQNLSVKLIYFIFFREKKLIRC